MNGVVQYHKSEAPRTYLQNTLSLFALHGASLAAVSPPAYALTTSVLTSDCDPVPCHLLMMIHVGLSAPAVGYS